MRRQLALACTVSAALALAACGSSSGGQPVTSPSTSSPAASPSSSTPAGSLADQSAEDIVAASLAASKAAGSFRMVARELSDGKPVVSDIRRADGVGGEATVKLAGAVIQIRGVDGLVYLRGNQVFWHDLAQAGKKAPLLAGKWFIVPAEQFAEQADLVNGDFAAFLDDSFKATGAVAKGKTKDIGGHSAIEIIDQGDNTSLWISLDGEPYPLLVTGAPGSDLTTITFTRWGEDLGITAPEGAVDLSNVL